MAEFNNRTAKHWEKIADAKVNGIGQTAEDLWLSALAYFMWCDSNPIYKSELVKSGEHAGEIYSVPIDRPYTLRGLCLHMGITIDYLYEVAKGKEKNDFFFVVKTILDIVHTQVLEGALAGVYAQVATIKHLKLDKVDDATKPNPTVQINVIANSPKLLTNEGDIDIPEDKR